MSTLQEIKEAIDRLSLQERSELMVMLTPPEYDEWDRQMMKDSETGGKLERLMARARNDFQDGKCAEWPGS